MNIVPVIVVHGGAGDIKPSAIQGKLIGVKVAVEKGSDVLLQNGTALDAVCAAVKSMEDDEAFNCGRGSVLNLQGVVENDAIIMDGRTLATGAVTGVRNVQYPSELARLVMEKSPHCLLAGQGAIDFAMQEKVPFIPAYRLVTQKAIDALENFLNGGTGSSEIHELGVGTVGAVALDTFGHIAVLTSTGGITGKYPGRVGDTPIPGSGGYADDTVGAASATGDGESIMRVCLTYDVLTEMRSGTSPTEASKAALERMAERIPGSGAGVIVISNTGDIGISFNTQNMAWAFRRGDGEIQLGIDEYQENKKAL